MTAEAWAADLFWAAMYSVMLTRAPRAQNGAPQVEPVFSFRFAATGPGRVAVMARTVVICLRSILLIGVLEISGWFVLIVSKLSFC